MAKRQITKAEYERAVKIRNNILKYVNIVLTVVSLLGASICAILAAFDVISMQVAGILVPAFLIVDMIMNILAAKEEKRKGIMIFYIIALILCIVVLFVDVVYYNFVK